MEAYKVYVMTDKNGYITAANSSAFVSGEDWTEIDEGLGDRFHHAQANYFPLPLMTEGGAWQYRLIDGVAAECSEEDIAAQEAEIAAQPQPPNDAERIAELEAALELLLSGATE